VSLGHTRAGSGPTLVLVHGLGGSSVIWRPVLDLLAAERDVIAVDLPGFGRSPLPADGFVPSAAALAERLIASLDELGVERPHIAGNSLGGWVALEAAARGRAASVAAISPAGLWRTPLGPRRLDTHRLGNRIAPVVRALVRTPRGRAYLLGSTVARPELVPAADAADLVTAWLATPAYAAANAEMRANVFKAAARVEVPVAIAWGQRDRLVGRPSRTRRPPGSRYLEMPGWGHTPTWDDPEGVARFLLGASDSRPSGSRRGG
jgi:pimeloyl-ACP methyl ester carboxylesterase